MSVNPRININTISNIKTKNTHFNGVRYYDPSLQRFLGEDPIGFASEDFNFYRYVENSPINLNDPTGLTSGMSSWEPPVDIYHNPNEPVEPWKKKPKPKKPRHPCCDWYPWIEGDESSKDIRDLDDGWIDCCRKTDVLPECDN